jgi:hypothetical protein
MAAQHADRERKRQLSNPQGDVPGAGGNRSGHFSVTVTKRSNGENDSWG